MNTKISLILSLLAILGSEARGEETTFLVGIHGVPATPQYEYRVRTNDPTLIEQCRAQLALPEAERILHVNGALDWGDGNFNAPWSWHIDPEDWLLTQFSIEICDGLPEMVEADLDYWITHIGRFCCWFSHIRAELPPTGILDPGGPDFQLAVNPNPFNPRVVVSFFLQNAAHVKLAIYDARGRNIVTLIDEARASGANRVVWNGRDIAGRTLAAGAYLCRLAVGNSVELARLVLIR